MATIDRNLNLIVPIDRGEEQLYVHCQPVGYEVFRKYWLVLSKTYAALAQQGLGAIGGSVCAHLMVEEIARTTPRAATGGDWWDGPDGVEKGLLGEIIRLSNVMTLNGENGWQPTMLSVALSRGILTEEEKGEVLANATFFSVTWRVSPPANRLGMMRGAAFLNNLLFESWDITALTNSLMMSTATASIGARQTRRSARS